jgi:hypothetical protein
MHRENQTMSSVVTLPERAEAGPCIAPCPIATQAQHQLAQLQFSQSASRALARPPVVADIATASTSLTA